MAVSYGVTHGKGVNNVRPPTRHQQTKARLLNCPQCGPTGTRFNDTEGVWRFRTHYKDGKECPYSGQNAASDPNAVKALERQREEEARAELDRQTAATAAPVAKPSPKPLPKKHAWEPDLYRPWGVTSANRGQDA